MRHGSVVARDRFCEDARATADGEVLSVARGASRQQRSPTPEQIKIAHRKTGLKHHPDKEVSSSTPQETSSIFTNLNTADDAFFKCIQKAHDVLTNPEKRRQFDSVDPTVLDAEEDDPKERAFAKKGRKLDDNAFFDTLGIHQMWRGSPPCPDYPWSHCWFTVDIAVPPGSLAGEERVQLEFDTGCEAVVAATEGDSYISLSIQRITKSQRMVASIRSAYRSFAGTCASASAPLSRATSDAREKATLGFDIARSPDFTSLRSTRVEGYDPRTSFEATEKLHVSSVPRFASQYAADGRFLAEEKQLKEVGK
ncbi:hypothetical protein EV715DRAFT_268620, partial [Schizophyllum commune]